MNNIIRQLMLIMAIRHGIMAFLLFADAQRYATLDSFITLFNIMGPKAWAVAAAFTSAICLLGVVRTTWETTRAGIWMSTAVTFCWAGSFFFTRLGVTVSMLLVAVFGALAAKDLVAARIPFIIVKE